MSSSRRSRKAGPKAPEPRGAAHDTLAAFMKQKAREKCPVCALPPEVRAQLGPPAAKRGFTRTDQVEWLNTVAAVTVTLDTLNAHFNARHDQEGV